jgi:DNA-binding PadR family transcriptional regulator
MSGGPAPVAQAQVLEALVKAKNPMSSGDMTRTIGRTVDRNTKTLLKLLRLGLVDYLGTANRGRLKNIVHMYQINDAGRAWLVKSAIVAAKIEAGELPAPFRLFGDGEVPELTKRWRDPFYERA